MGTKFDFKKFLPHILIIAGLALIALFFSFPQLEGKVLSQGDVSNWKGMSHEASTFHEKTGEQVLWSNSMFGGMPTYIFYIGKTNNYVAYIHEAIVGLIGRPASFMFIAMLCFYILMRTLRINKWIAVAGSIAFAFSSFNIVSIGAGHDTKVFTMGYMPAVLAGVLLLYRSDWWKGIAVLGVSFTLMMANAHYQIIYYVIIILIIMVITLFVIAIREKKLKEFFISSFVALAVAAVAAGPNLQTLLATMEYNKTTMRGGQSELTFNHDKEKKTGGLDKEYAFRWSNSWGETFCLMIPGLYGGSNAEDRGEGSKTYETLSNMGVPAANLEGITANLPLYWGPQPFLAGPIYFGAIVCMLFVLGLLVVRSPHKWWIVVACVLGIIMSTGRHFPAFNYWMFDHMPMLNKFRVPSMILAIPQLLFPLLGMWALNDIIKEKITREELWKHVRVAAGITAGICLLFGLGASAFFSFRSPNDERTKEQYAQAFGNEQAGGTVMSAILEDRASYASSSALTSAVFILLAGGLLWAFSKRKVEGKYMVMGIGLLIAVDLMMVDSRYLNESNYKEAEEEENAFVPRQVDQQILQDPDPYYRVLDVTKDVYNDGMQAYFHKSIGGYSPAKMEIYQDMIDVHLGGKFNQQVLNMLNTKYIIFGGGQNGEAVAMPNAEANGNAWFVRDVQWAATADEEILSMKGNVLGDTTRIADEFDTKNRAVIRNTFKKELDGYQFGKDSSANVKLAKYGLNEISFTSTNSQNGLAVFSDIYYPHGWKAYVDGKETPIIKANYILRAIKVPAGNHKIDFKFHPQSFENGDKIAMVSSLLLIGLLITAIFKSLKGDDKEEDKKGLV